MSGALLRLQNLAAQLFPSSTTPSAKGNTSSNHESSNVQEYNHRYNFHTLSPTSFLPRAAAIEPNVLLHPPFHFFCCKDSRHPAAIRSDTCTLTPSAYMLAYSPRENFSVRASRCKIGS